jgi:hypothetical protein
MNVVLPILRASDKLGSIFLWDNDIHSDELTATTLPVISRTGNSYIQLLFVLPSASNPGVMLAQHRGVRLFLPEILSLHLAMNKCLILTSCFCRSAPNPLRWAMFSWDFIYQSDITT